jgi:hypothetical protein
MNMSILAQLSSQTGDRTEASNLKVVAQCLENPDLLIKIAEGLKDSDQALVGDCAEILTKVAEVHPAWVVPFAEALSMLLPSKNTRVRWEATHALALVAYLTPATIAPLLPLLMDKLRTDPSVIVRDYATDAIANYASTDKTAAECAYPLLKETLTLWGGKQAGHALLGLTHVARLVPTAHSELLTIANEYLGFSRGVVAKAAKGLLKVLNSQLKSAG